MKQITSPLLDVTDLQVRFHTPEGTIFAVNGISFHIQEGEAVAVVGESGSGKSVCMMSILGLIPIPPGEIASGTAVFLERDLLHLSRQTELELVRGRDIGMIFQDPMTSLNPVLTLGRQLTEAAFAILTCLLRKRANGPWSCCTWWAFPMPTDGWATSRTNFPAGCANG
jgi:oligopeptide transport system ATP-binding protein